MKDLVVALTDTPQDLNPYQSNNLHIHTVMWPIYEPLFDIGLDNNHKLEFRPCLSAIPKPVGDRMYEFALREGVTFSNGAQFNAKSVVDNLDKVAKQNPTSFRERILHDLINRVQLRGPHTVRVTLNYPYPELLFLALMTDQSSPPLGTGPFRLDSADTSGFVLRKYDDYREPAKLDTITFRVIRNPDDLVTEFNGNRLDFIRDIDTERLHKLAGPPQRIDVAPFGLHYLGFNWGSTAFKTPAVRQAFRDTIDFKQIEKRTGLQSAKGPIPPNVEGYAGATLSSAQQTRAEARSTLEKACGGKISLLYNENSYYGAELADFIESGLGSNLVNREPQPNSRQLLQAIKGRGHENGGDHYVFIYNWYSILPAAEIFLRPLFVTGMPDNLTGYNEPAVNAVFSDIQNGKISAADGYEKVQEKIIADMPAIYLGHSRVRHSALSARVQLNPKPGVAPLNVQSFPVDRYVGVDVL